MAWSKGRFGQPYYYGTTEPLWSIELPAPHSGATQCFILDQNLLSEPGINLVTIWFLKGRRHLTGTPIIVYVEGLNSYYVGMVVTSIDTGIMVKITGRFAIDQNE